MGLIEDILDKHKRRAQVEVGRVVREKVNELKEQGLSEQQIAERLDVNPKAVRVASQRLAQVKKTKELKDKGMSNLAIAKELGLSESVVRRMLHLSEKK